MAGYNPLSYFSFGRKKDAPTDSQSLAEESPDLTEDLQEALSSEGAHREAEQASDESFEVEQADQPILRIVKGNPTDEEIAALTALFAARQAAQVQQEQSSILTAASRLLNRRQRLGASLRPGPGSWRRARPM